MLELKHISKSFGDLNVLDDVDLKINEGEVVSIIGPSGTGKSTLLRCINFLEKPDKGIITLENHMVNAEHFSKNEIKMLRQSTGMVFQNFNLFKNRTVLENITEGLIAVKKLKKTEAEKIAEEVLNQVGLSDKRNSYPATLSGGQQQRVAIGRAVAMSPKILLFDEPTSALDPEKVNEVLELIRELALKNMTMMIVTHEISFARNVSDKVCFMDGGKILESGKPEEVIDNPKNERTRKFLKFITKKLDI